ncbi:TPA: PBP1A family penicillin-binding protein [Legionella pneumophila subsp. pneumophila]|uniref:penicillin-binding protein 1A n=1 Tax=Legionella pneumophila TaxID=446 RepID=UPI000770B165|nr:penicillin-binding protein 1A [Legionella pneumophila]HAT9088677.1 PBP1A family penicillin-binding protein [Legionella pneumophila subsp. pneumophila]CZJ07281.1 Penicillin-binding protein 1A [Legionella pneumophila]CZJ07957.1 Penicillin-binding protein 1A [Legionella pneumophila]CZJ09556.1 Penicillin-binding protein 1A [Legionella pneumophila]CZJ10154.1 Penicillin-binding protein 1A [Legionella pneumophila]
MKKMAYFWRKGLWALMSLFFLLIVAGSLLYLYLESQLPNVDSLKTVQLQVPLQIFSKEGLLIQEYGEKKRIPVTYDEIPPTLIHALIATEDQRFFEHPGVDVMGLGRAAVSMLKTGTKSQGGSTITMQVARNFFLSRKKTFLRKFNEIMLAIKIDRELSKEKILELYLNRVYLGNRAYGVGAAAMVYFGKSLKDLNLAELAMIAGLPQAPSTQNPIANPLAAKKRRDHVLERLLEEHYINEEQYQNAVNQPITAKYHGTNIKVKAPYVAEMIRQSLYDNFGPEAYTKGYKVYTTIDGKLQNTANEVVEKNLIAYDHRHGYRGPIANIGEKDSQSPKIRQKYLRQYPELNSLIPAVITEVREKEATAALQNGQIIIIPWEGMSWARPALKRGGWVGKSPTKAQQVVAAGDIIYVHPTEKSWQLAQIPEAESAMVAMNPKNGAIEVLVGGFNFSKSKFNRATQSSRQPGSSFKPFVYAAALNNGYNLATLINDAPIVVDDPSQPNLWRPHNVNLKFNGPTRLKQALVQSKNLVSIRILDDIGIDYTIDFLTRFGFNKKSLPRALSLALGSLSISPMDLTTAYAVFANGGYKVEPYLIDHIADADGKILLQAKPSVVCDPCDKDKVDTSTLAPRVISEDIAFLMNTALRDVIQHGTGRAARVLNRQDIAGKTGTTNDQVDAWFAGFNPNLVVTTWIGFDNPKSLHEYAANLALPLWIDFMKVALKDKPETELKQPENVIAVRIDPVSGLLAKPNQENGIIEYFRQNEVPSEEDQGPVYNAHNDQQEEELAPVEESLF